MKKKAKVIGKQKAIEVVLVLMDIWHFGFKYQDSGTGGNKEAHKLRQRSLRKMHCAKRWLEEEGVKVSCAEGIDGAVFAWEFFGLPTVSIFFLKDGVQRGPHNRPIRSGPLSKIFVPGHKLIGKMEKSFTKRHFLEYVFGRPRYG